MYAQRAYRTALLGICTVGVLEAVKQNGVLTALVLLLWVLGLVALHLGEG